MNISILANVSLPQFLNTFPTQELLNKIEYFYQTHVNSFKIHAMATHHGRTDKPLEKDSDPKETNVTIHDEYRADVNDFENVELDPHARLRDLTNDIDYL